MGDTTPTAEEALAYATGYAAGLDEAKNTDAAQLIKKVGSLEACIALERALTSDTERRLADLQAWHAQELARLRAEKAELEAQVAALAGALGDADTALLYCSLEPGMLRPENNAQRAVASNARHKIAADINNLPAAAAQMVAVMEAAKKRVGFWTVSDGEGQHCADVCFQFNTTEDATAFKDAVIALPTKTETPT